MGDRFEEAGDVAGAEVFEISTNVPGLFVVEPLELLRAYPELDRNDARERNEYRIDPLADLRDVELRNDGPVRVDERRYGRTLLALTPLRLGPTFTAACHE